jgi:hypothetical protein
MPDPNRAEIWSVVARTNPGTGTDEIVTTLISGERHVYPGSWSEAQELATRAGLTHAEYTSDGTIWTRRRPTTQPQEEPT